MLPAPMSQLWISVSGAVCNIKKTPPRKVKETLVAFGGGTTPMTKPKYFLKQKHGTVKCFLKGRRNNETTNIYSRNLTF
jgi:hypothetical protein